MEMIMNAVNVDRELAVANLHHRELLKRAESKMLFEQIARTDASARQQTPVARLAARLSFWRSSVRHEYSSRGFRRFGKSTPVRADTGVHGYSA